MAKIKRAEDLFWPTPGHLVETITNLDAIPIAENGEPLIVLQTAFPALIIRPLGKREEADTSLWARESVGSRLVNAQERLSASQTGLQLVVVDAWRPPGEQRKWHRRARILFRLLHPTWPAALIREAANKYVAAPDAVAPPPHSTGGAIDVRLWDKQGKEIPMGRWTGGAARTEFENLPEEQRANRRLLRDAMEAAGFSNYEEEWWHYSYGDSGWALRTNRETAFFGRTAPPTV